MSHETVDINLTSQELQVLSELDRYCAVTMFTFSYVTVLSPFPFSSRQFGFLQLNAEEHANKKALVIRVIIIRQT